MARDFEEYLKAALTGGSQGVQAGMASGMEMEKAIMLEKIKSAMTPREYKPTTMEESLEFERAKAGIISPKEALQTKFIQARLNQIEGGEERLTPIERRQQRGETSKLVSGLQVIPIKKSLVSDAIKSSENLPKGLIGKWNMKRIMAFDPENPVVEDWQKVKMVLTDATLLNTAMTKGAISDMEMREFQKAAANDDVASVARMRPVFDKLMKFLEAEEKGLQESYSINYGDKALEKVKSKLGVIQPPTGGESKIEVTNPNGKRVKIKASQLQDALQQGYKR